MEDVEEVEERNEGGGGSCRLESIELLRPLPPDDEGMYDGGGGGS